MFSLRRFVFVLRFLTPPCCIKKGVRGAKRGQPHRRRRVKAELTNDDVTDNSYINNTNYNVDISTSLKSSHEWWHFYAKNNVTWSHFNSVERFLWAMFVSAASTVKNDFLSKSETTWPGNFEINPALGRSYTPWNGVMLHFVIVACRLLWEFQSL